MRRVVFLGIGLSWVAALAACTWLVSTDGLEKAALPADADVDARPRTGDADGLDAASDRPGDLDAAIDPDATGPGVFCGATYCDPRASVCCQDDCNTLFGGCNPKGDCPEGPAKCLAAYRCDDRLDCVRLGRPSDVCCLLTTASPNLAECRSLVVCSMAPHKILCDPGIAAPCPGDAACGSDGSGRFYCRGL